MAKALGVDRLTDIGHLILLLSPKSIARLVEIRKTRSRPSGSLVIAPVKWSKFAIQLTGVVVPSPRCHRSDCGAFGLLHAIPANSIWRRVPGRRLHAGC